MNNALIMYIFIGLTMYKKVMDQLQQKNNYTSYYKMVVLLNKICLYRNDYYK